MNGRAINLIVIHCSASPNGVALGRNGKTAAQVIDGWHQQRGFSRAPTWRLQWNSSLQSIGYHFVIDTDGTQQSGRHIDEIGAHVAGFNIDSIGICCVGTDAFTRAQWGKLNALVLQLRKQYFTAKVLGHRDLSPDLNHDGKIEPNEYMKLCPGFNVSDWLLAMQPVSGHIIEVAP